MVWLINVIIFVNTLQLVSNEKIKFRKNARRKEDGIFVYTDPLDPHKPNGFEVLVSTSFTNHGQQNTTNNPVQTPAQNDVRFPSNPNTYILSSTVGHQHRPSTPRTYSPPQTHSNIPQQEYFASNENINVDEIQYPSYPTIQQTSYSTNYNNAKSVFKDVIHTVGSFFRAIQTFPNFISGTDEVRGIQTNYEGGSQEGGGTKYTPTFYAITTSPDQESPVHHPANDDPSSSEHHGYGESTKTEWNPTWSTLGDVCV